MDAPLCVHRVNPHGQCCTGDMQAASGKLGRGGNASAQVLGSSHASAKAPKCALHLNPRAPLIMRPAVVFEPVHSFMHACCFTLHDDLDKLGMLGYYNSLSPKQAFSMHQMCRTIATQSLLLSPPVPPSCMCIQTVHRLQDEPERIAVALP